MPDEDDGVSQVFDRMRDWDEWGRRLMGILQEVKEKTGEAPVWFRDDGEAFMHPDLAQKLNEPGNEGPLEFLRYMKGLAVPKEWYS